MGNIKSISQLHIRLFSHAVVYNCTCGMHFNIKIQHKAEKEVPKRTSCFSFMSARDLHLLSIRM